MNHYRMRIEPTDGTPPTVWEGDAVCFMDACILARRTVDPTLGNNQVLTQVRSFSDTTKLTSALPLRVLSG
jgi:hypothetical protein